MRQADITALAPVAVYTYTRVDHVVRTLESLRRNHLAPYTVLYLVSDGAKDDAARPAVQRIRDHVDDLTGFREVVRVYREKNLGLRISPPSAEQMILGDHGRIINMEDDNLTSPNFLDFMNAGLQHFEDDPAVYSICGYCPPLSAASAGDFWRFPWNLSWGYAVWKRKHDRFHPLDNRYREWRSSGLLRRQNAAGGLYVSDSARRDFLGQKYFPDATLCTRMFEAGMQAVVPTVSKVHNTGQDGSGQSSGQVTDKYDAALDTGDRRSFDFDHESPDAARNRCDVVALMNGDPLTRAARQLGLYHRLSSLRTRWSP
jgi:GT2 family glycosyltransferase